MANQLELFYSSFSGIDTRSNKLLQDPKSFRRGSKNFRYDFQDQITNAQGFQHKDSGAPNFVDIFEYKYRDVNTGAALTQVLGVATDGHLYRRKQHFLKFNTYTGYTSVSVFYDDVVDTFKLVLNGATPQTVTISDTMTLSQLETALDAISGVSVTIVDDSGATVAASTSLAYLLDCVIDDTTFANNGVYFWEIVPCSSVPFPNAISQPSNYEGISSVNINNAIYMTEGWFIMKYDGYSVYRAGMPKFSRDLGVNNTTFFDYATGSLTANSNYRYAFQFGFVGPSGNEILGKVTEIDYVQASLPAGRRAIEIPIFPIGNSDATNDCFPVYSCAVNGAQTLSGTGSKTLTVDSGHNIKVGMCLRLTVSNLGFSGTNKGISFGYLEVTGVTATTITFNKTKSGLQLLEAGTYTTYCAMALNNSSSALPDVFPDDFVLNGCYVPDVVKGVFTEPDEYTSDELGKTQAWAPQIIYGAFVRILRSKGGDVNNLYRLIDAPISHQKFYKILDQLADVDLIGSVIGSLTTIPADFTSGDELPRACKYLTTWQGSIVQAGRPVNETGILNKNYPWYYAPPPPSVGNKWGFAIPFPPWTYQENNLCDEQSIYWADPITPEGFPQDGLHEFTIETKFSDRITAIAPNKDALFALKQRSTAVLTGSLGTNDIVMEVLESDAGCSSHKSVEEVRGSLVWLDGINGFYSCVAGRLPENIGFPIQDYQKINAQKLDYTKATAANFRKESLYICSVGTTTFVFDYADNGSLKRNCWYIWDRLDGKSVLATSDDKLLIWDGIRTWKMKLTLTKYDFTDHKSAISMVLNTAWLNQGHPTIDKHYVGLWINSIQGDFTLTVKQYGNFLEDLIGTQTNVEFIPETSAKKFIKAQVKASLPKLSSISFGIENAQKNKWVRIQGYEVQYSTDFAVGEPKR